MLSQKPAQVEVFAVQMPQFRGALETRANIDERFAQHLAAADGRPSTITMAFFGHSHASATGALGLTHAVTGATECLERAMAQ